MNLSRLDLDLVVALRALLEERDLTRAGQRVGRSLLIASGYAVEVLGAEPARVMHEEAPGIRPRLAQTPTTVVDATDTL
ncbi:hypothetical protein [Streptomyces sp. E2N166]|uniref:hypothetical protein n=1 Tax=Streptomyces sp. E2N166 TaxID=1851909 RepID=UPI001EE8B9F9|nr:hypothetical protein [Streptomyces sp. E2N166]